MYSMGEIERAWRFRRGQYRILVTTIIGYTLFCFLRKNLSLAMPGLARDYGITKTSLGVFFPLHGVVYALGKFVRCPLSDQCKLSRLLCAALTHAGRELNLKDLVTSCVPMSQGAAAFARILNRDGFYCKTFLVNEGVA